MKNYKVAACMVLAALTGCAGNVKLIEGGNVYAGRYDSVTKTMEATVDNVLYKGTYITDTQTAGGGYWFKGRYIATSSVSGGTSGRALLLSPDNKVLRCEFMAQSMSAQGTCQDGNGRTFDLVAGQ